jgi:hypothetical protein
VTDALRFGARSVATDRALVMANHIRAGADPRIAEVCRARQVVDMSAGIVGDRPPALVLWALS